MLCLSRLSEILLFSLILVWVFSFAAQARAQATINVAQGNTHQTWRFYGGNVATSHFDDSACSVVSSALFNQAVAFLNDVGVNDGRIEIKPVENIESSDGAAFVYTNVWKESGVCPTTATNDFNDAKNWLALTKNRGINPQTTLTFITFNPSNMPTWWLNGEGSDSAAKETTEAYQATIDYIFNNYGFCPAYVKFNEPDNNGLISNYGGTPSWVASLTNQFTSTIGNDPHCSGVGFLGPEMESGNSVLANLSTYYGAVSGSEAKLAYITYHSYPLPSDNGAAIYSHASGEGKQTAMTEAFYSNSDFNTAENYLVSYFLPEINVGNLSGWDWLAIWGVCYNKPGCPPSTSSGSLGIAWEPNGASTFYLQPAYYVFRQFSKYVQPGYVRVDAPTSDSAVPVTAWKRPDGTLVVMVVNAHGSTQSVTVSGLPNLNFNVHKLDPTMCTTTGQFRCTPDDCATITPSGGSTTLSMPAGAVWTLAETPAPPCKLNASPQ